MFDPRDVNIVIELFGVLVCAVGIVCALLFGRGDKRWRHYLVALFAIELVSVGADAVAGVFRGQPGTVAWLGTHVGNFATFAGSYVLVAVFTSYFTLRVEDAVKSVSLRVWRRAVWVLALVFCVLTVFNVFYTIDQDNLYARTDLYWLSLAPTVLVQAVNFAILIAFRKELTWTMRATVAIYTLFPLPALVAQMSIYGLNLVAVVTVVGVMVVFLDMLSFLDQTIVDQQRDLARSRMELQESRVEAMMSQIQPHFLYNTLDSIYYLCGSNPQRAQKAIGDFSRYLRNNLGSVRRTVPVPIRDELEHVKTYLELEHLSSDDTLHYDFDVEATGFCVPALSVQPLVENAVRHGIGARPEGGTVTVRTRELRDCYTVTVHDDGVGFDVASQGRGDGMHIGIGNVRDRVESMCAGTLTISSTPGVGTDAVIRIPKQGA